MKSLNQTIMTKLQQQHKRYKLIYFLLEFAGANLDKQLTELAKRIDSNDPQVDEALDYFEDSIIKILETPKQKSNEKVRRKVSKKRKN